MSSRPVPALFAVGLWLVTGTAVILGARLWWTQVPLTIMTVNDNSVHHGMVRRRIDTSAAACAGAGSNSSLGSRRSSRNS